MGIKLSSLQTSFLKIRNNNFFEFIVIAVILLSALSIGIKTYPINPKFKVAFQVFDIVITIFFLTEVIIRLRAEERMLDFFKYGWNVFDFIIVATSLMPMESSDMAILARLLRIFRVLRLVSIIPELRILINALLVSIPRMGYVLLLMFIIFYIYGAAGNFLFSDINSTLWGNISIAMLTLFRIATFEDWTDVMYETMEVHHMSWIYYLSFIFFTAFIFLNMMIGIVVGVLQEEHEKHNREINSGEAGGEVHWIKEQVIELNQRMKRIEELLKNK
jgi:voltage-gated sodium channel